MPNSEALSLIDEAEGILERPGGDKQRALAALITCLSRLRAIDGSEYVVEKGTIILDGAPAYVGVRGPGSRDDRIRAALSGLRIHFM